MSGGRSTEQLVELIESQRSTKDLSGAEAQRLIDEKGREWIRETLRAVLQDTRDAVWANAQAAVEIYESAMALVALMAFAGIDRDSSQGQPLAEELNRKYHDLANAISEIRGGIDALEQRSKHFWWVHADVINAWISRIGETRRCYVKVLLGALPRIGGFRPALGELLDVERLLELDKNIVTYERRLRAFRPMGDLHRRAARDADSRDEERARRAIGRLYDRVSRVYAQLLGEHERERRQLERRLPERTVLRTRRYLAALRTNPEALRFHARALRLWLAQYYGSAWFGPTLRSGQVLSWIRSIPPDQLRRWAETLNERLVSGHERFSLQRILAALFTGYVRANRALDPGVDVAHGVGTYVGHGHYAVDIHADAGEAVRAAAPTEFTIASDRCESDDAQQYRYERTRVVPNRTRATTTVQDVFSKLAYGLGLESSAQVRRLIPKRPDAEEVSAALRGEVLLVEADDITARPAEVGGRQMTPTHVSRAVAALVYKRLYAGVSVPTGIDELRRDLLFSINRELEQRLNLPRGPIRQEVIADEGAVGFVEALDRELLREHDVSIGRAVRALHRMIRGNVAVSSEGPAIEQAWGASGLTDRLWRFLWVLVDAGARPHRRGAAATVEHVYSSAGESIVVQVFVTHLSVVADIQRIVESEKGQLEIDRNKVIGEVGTTGSARSSHNHVEIRVRSEDGRFVRGLWPHEFFPAPDWFWLAAR